MSFNSKYSYLLLTCSRAKISSFKSSHGLSESLMTNNYNVFATSDNTNETKQIRTVEKDHNQQL